MAANLARNGGQDVHKLLGLKRRLRRDEQRVFSFLVLDLMEHEFKPSEELAKAMVGGGTARFSDE